MNSLKGKSMLSILIIIFLVIAATACFPALAAEPVSAQQKEMLEKLRQLEEQIRELKEQKQTFENQVKIKKEECIKAVGLESFCSCLSVELPGDIGFERYVHIAVTPKDRLEGKDAELIPAVRRVREMCIK